MARRTTKQAVRSEEEKARTDLLCRSKRDDKSAFEDFMMRMKSPMRLALRCRAWWLTADDQDDILQTSWLRAWFRRGQFDPVAGGATVWMWTIVRHCAIDVLRARRRKPAGSLEPEEVVDRRVDAASAVEARDELVLVRRKIQEILSLEIDERVRRAWELLIEKDLSYAEVAQTLSVPGGTVAGWIHRVRRRLRILHEWKSQNRRATRKKISRPA